MNAPQYVVDREGNRTSVLLDIESWDELMERLDDAEDARLILEAEQDDPQGSPLDVALARVDAERALLLGTT